jgi:SAM-dependent methyltransferase
MKKKIPWWLKILVKIIFSRLPLKYSFWQSIGLFRHGKMDESNYSLRIFEEHLSKSKIKSLQNKVILEIGPGDSIATSIISYAYGASSILVDSGYFAKSNIFNYIELKDELITKKLNPPDIFENDELDEILKKSNSKYLTGGFQSLKSIPSNSIDLIFSQAVLEHIRLKDFEPMNAELYRVLKKDGIISHQIDLRDHLGGGLNNLRFGDKLWESSFFAESGFYTNRIGFEKMLAVFKALKFNYKILNIQRWEFLPLKKEKMHKKYREQSTESLSVKVFDIILNK